jgi:hypothetical protein
MHWISILYMSLLVSPSLGHVLEDESHGSEVKAIKSEDESHGHGIEMKPGSQQIMDDDHPSYQYHDIVIADQTHYIKHYTVPEVHFVQPTASHDHVIVVHNTTHESMAWWIWVLIILLILILLILLCCCWQWEYFYLLWCPKPKPKKRIIEFEGAPDYPKPMEITPPEDWQVVARSPRYTGEGEVEFDLTAQDISAML